jgi:glutamate racemase
MDARHSIGVFDSGVGGLSVLREIRRALAHEDLLYIADSAHAPYGDRSTEWIAARSLVLSEALIARGAKAIVVACNTATGAAAAALRAAHAVPVIAIEPAIKPAVLATRTGIIGVLATRRTLASEKFAQLRARFGSQVQILEQACPGLMECVEAGDFTSVATRSLALQFITPMIERGADVVALGCTHYPFLLPLLRELAPTINFIDPAPAVAAEVRRRLEIAGLLSRETRPGIERFLTSGEVTRVGAVIERLWGSVCAIEALPVS